MPNKMIPNTFISPTNVSISTTNQLVVIVQERVLTTSPIVGFKILSNNIHIETKSGSKYHLLDMNMSLVNKLDIQYRTNLFS